MELIDQVMDQNPGTQFLSCWDFDGTLLKGDIGEGLHDGGEHEYLGLAEEAIARGFIPNYQSQDALERFWKDYNTLAEQQS